MKRRKIISSILSGIIVLLLFTACEDPLETLRVFNLTIETDGHGKTDPAGLVEVNKGVSLDILAEPNNGYSFKSWEVVSGTGVIFGSQTSADTTVTLNESDATIKANFTADQYILSVTHSGSGSTVPAGASIVDHGETVDITATPETGWDFHSWVIESGSAVAFGNASSASTTVILSGGDATISAEFVEEGSSGYYLTITIDGNGSVTQDSSSIPAGVPFGIDAVPDTGSHFLNWTQTGGSGTAEFATADSESTTVTLTGGNATIQANFVLDSYTLTVNNDGKGTTDPAGGISVNYGVATDILAIPNEGYSFSQWTVFSGSGASFDNANAADTTVTLISGNVTIRANFTLSGYGASIDQSYINSNNEDAMSFTFSNAVSGYTYDFSIDDTNGSTAAVTGSGTIVTSSDQITGIDVSSLDDDLLTLTAYLTDGQNNPSGNFYDTVSKKTVLPSFNSIDDGGGDNTYMPGETITFDVDMGETGLTMTADFSVLDSAFSSSQALDDDGDNTYSFTTAALDSGTMAEGPAVAVAFTAVDAAGNSNTDNSFTLLLDKTPPSGSFVINSGNSFTASESVTLNMSVSSATLMRFGNSTTERDAASWEAYSASKAWSLASGSGLVTVYGEFRDAVGNTYLTSDDINHNKLVASDGASNDNYGYSAAMSSDGSTIVIGATRDVVTVTSGSVYVYSGTNWGTETKLTPSDGGSNDYFGRSVAVSSDGSTIAVGASSNSDNGSVYVYSGTNWGTEKKLTASDGAADDYFGYSISMSSDGSIIVIGAYADDDVQTASGSAYVFEKSTGWVNGSSNQTLKLTASVPGYTYYFGFSVAISADGSTIVAGATRDVVSTVTAGAVYLYNGTNWGTETRLTSADPTNLTEFGHSVSISSDGSTIAIGTNGAEAAYVFEEGAGWAAGSGNQSVKLTTSNSVPPASFGQSVSISSDGSTVVVGAYSDDAPGSNSGSVFIYSGTSWGTETKLTAADGAANDRLGFCVSISPDGSTVTAGAYGDDSSRGAGYIYR